MARELRMFLLAIVLPAVFVAAGGAWMLYGTWQRMWDDEREELQLQAEFLADAIEGRIHELYGGLGRHGPPPGKPQGSGKPPPRVGVNDRNADRRPPPPPEHRLTDEKRKKIASICTAICKRRPAFGSATAFAVVDPDGGIIFTTLDWPHIPGTVVECSLGPESGDCSLCTTRADGGAAMRARAIGVVALGGCLVLLLVAALVSAGIVFIRDIRRERSDARAKADFLDTVSHELRTPIAGMRLNAELIAEGRVADGEPCRNAASSILSEADRLNRMVGQMLDFARLVKNRRRFSISPINLTDFVSRLPHDQVVSALAGDRLSTVLSSGSDAAEPVIALADADALREIVLNLVENACKYSQGMIEVTVYSACGSAFMSVIDSGPGIAPENAERVFERFFRVDDSLTAKTGGCGLGLPISRALAYGMDGNLKYSPHPGGGSEFILELPMYAEDGKEGES